MFCFQARPLVGALALGAAILALDARAAWPPPENATAADMADPANWPNDPKYAFGEDEDGQWQYYSFIPKTAENVRKQEKAAGMSVDLAWRLTIGDPSIVIAITDSGIRWDKKDLINKVWLNAAELVNHKPRSSDDTPCGGEGPLSGFDCNGDGVFSITDYATTPSLEPAASTDHPQGDRNQNGVLDPGDLILAFSDGVDDDANGYVDDIAGWDFLKNDNDPFDDTKNGHGSRQAQDSVAETNNNDGGAGACPLCRFLPMRVADSFIADNGNFSKGVLYAVDQGASVIQCALGNLTNSRFTQAALDYARAHDVVTIASMADENERHHNMPTVNNHTLPVHAIQFDGSSVAESASFVTYHTCSNYGGQNLLSASGHGCSSEAAAQLAGIAGLVRSASIRYMAEPTLTAGEVEQLLLMNADDINVPESHEPETIYMSSQPGFDQRFGYGRVNANKSVESVRDGRIPPSVDITSPRWFTNFYASRGPKAVKLEGTISAPRAKSYDVRVEWGAGVEPLDDAFHVAHEEKNIASSVVIGAKAPIATIALADIDVTHDRDRDSPHGENDFTFTVRVRATAHYGGKQGDVTGEMRRTYYLHDDKSLVKGFPLYVGDSGESSPKLADLDGDGIRDIIYATGGGVVHALKMTSDGPEGLPGFPFLSEAPDGLHPGRPAPHLAQPAYGKNGIDLELAHESFNATPAIADLDGDGKLEIVVTSFAGTIYVLGADGKSKPGWPLRLPDVPSCPLELGIDPPKDCMGPKAIIDRGAFASPVLEDLDGDKKLDIIQAAFDGRVYVFNHKAQPVAGFPVEVHYQGSLADEEPARNRIITTPAVADVNGDGKADILVGSNEKLGSGEVTGAVYLIDGRGTNAPDDAYLPNWPVTISSLNLFPTVAEGITTSPVITNLDGKPVAVFHGTASRPELLPLDPGPQGVLNELPPNALPEHDDREVPGTRTRGLEPSIIFGNLSKATPSNTMIPLFAQPSIADMDQDGVLDVITSGGSINMAINLQAQAATGLPGEHLLAMWSGKTGAMLPGSPMLLEDFTFFNNQAIADLDGDDYPEVITGSGGYFVHAYNGCGAEPKGWPKFTGQWVVPTVAVGDIDGDHALEVIVGTRSGYLYAWKTKGRDDGQIAWESFHHDNRNTGDASVQLDQGSKRLAAKPLDDNVCLGTEPPAAEDDSTGDDGCGCTLPGRHRTPWGTIALVVTLFAATRMRKGGRRAA